MEDPQEDHTKDNRGGLGSVVAVTDPSVSPAPIVTDPTVAPALSDSGSNALRAIDTAALPPVVECGCLHSKLVEEAVSSPYGNSDGNDHDSPTSPTAKLTSTVEDLESSFGPINETAQEPECTACAGQQQQQQQLEGL